ncbi:uncharacterized protein C8Q71DRAFT_910277 [Rhodofomes roseus]|uniref:F-box domain-containing protein n=1 Tax=Rhodofomes roseus TaxID=34475 RepID=A0ABQ8K5N5_9APHY|nr:uncharacterized protein C8Q71DRAFT_910277 [Rhodofomes roseus]KAH9832297.1 hypothetical protein C8Q71DRAFT_910277 [Rhodofomes roseus]
MERRCWTIQRIVDSIAHYVYWDEDDPRRPRNTVSLALTSHFIYERTGTLVWSCQGDLVPLLKCLPKELWVIEYPMTPPGEKPAPRPKFRRQPAGLEWARVDANARQIRLLCFNMVWHRDNKMPVVRLDPKSCIPVLRSRYAQVPLLPNLEWLSCTLQRGQPYEHLELYVSPPLRHLHITTSTRAAPEEGDERVIETLLRGVVGPNVTEFTFYRVFVPTSSILSITSIIPGLEHIRIRLPPVGWRRVMLGVLARLPALEELILFDSGNVGGANGTEIATDEGKFRALKNLSLYVDTFSTGIPIMRALACAPLESVQVFVCVQPCNYDVTSSTGLAEFFQACGENRLRHLRNLNVYQVAEPHGKPSIVNMLMLEPVCRIWRLQRVRLWVPCVFDIDNHDITTMAQSWPDLRSLHLGLHHRKWEETRINLKGLESLA